MLDGKLQLSKSIFCCIGTIACFCFQRRAFWGEQFSREIRTMKQPSNQANTKSNGEKVCIFEIIASCCRFQTTEAYCIYLAHLKKMFFSAFSCYFLSTIFFLLIFSAPVFHANFFPPCFSCKIFSALFSRV